MTTMTDDEKAIHLYCLQRDHRVAKEQKIRQENPHIGVIYGNACEWDKFYSYQTGHYVESYNIEDLI